MLTRRSPMKRTPFKSKIGSTAGARNVGLARTGRVNPRRETPRRVDRATGRTDEATPEEKAYMARVRELECCALGMLGHYRCFGPPIVHHAGKHGAGFKSSHYETIALCWGAHDELHTTPGNGWTVASGLDGEGIRAFEDKHIARTQRLLGYTPGSASND